MRAFGELLKLVPDAQRAELLATKNNDGVPGLWMALGGGHGDAVRAFGELLKLVPEAQRAELLAAKNNDGFSGLGIALESGHGEAVRAFGELLQLVPEEQRAELLAAESLGGTSALANALENGELYAVEWYIETVKKITPNLSAQDCKALLTYIEESHAEKKSGLVGSRSSVYNELQKNNPSFYWRFEQMKEALKTQALKKRTYQPEYQSEKFKQRKLG